MPPSSRWTDLIEWATDFAKSNPIVTATFVTGLFGGLTLFVYCLIIGQAPDFTISDILGTFIASCLAGCIVLCAFAFTCIAPGALARYVLDSVLPQKPEASHYWVADKQRAEPAYPVQQQMRATLLTGAFPVELSGLAVLTWSLISIREIAEYCWPVAPVVVMTLHIVALACLAALVFLSTRLDRTLLIVLRVITVFGGFAIIALCLFHRVGFPSPESLANSTPLPTVQEEDTSPSASHLVVGLYACYVMAATLAVIVTGLFVNLALKGERKQQLRLVQGPKYPDPRPSLSSVRFWVAIWYVGPSILPLLAALRLADANGPAHALRSLALIILYLALFNFVFFLTASLKDNFPKAYLLAIGLFATLLLTAVQKPTIVPKAVVYALGYGNFHAPIVLLAASECPRLRAYGVDCEAKRDEAIALENVNVISRLGANATLELLVRREGQRVNDELEAAQLVPDTDITGSVGGPPPVSASDSDAPRFILHTSLSSGDLFERNDSIHLLHARQCDEIAASWLRVPDHNPQAYRVNHEREIRLWCVRITIRKDALLDYDKDGWRSYRGGYSSLIGQRPNSTAVGK